MLADLVRLIHRRRSLSAYETGFVSAVSVRLRAPRNRRVERFITGCWIVILAKCAGVYWLFGHYRIPLDPLWVVGPTVLFAALATAVYFLRD